MTSNIGCKVKRGESKPLAEEERAEHDTKKLREEIRGLIRKVAICKNLGRTFTMEMANQDCPYLCATSELLVKKILDQDPTVERNAEILLQLMESHQRSEISGIEMDKSFGIQMATQYFPKEALDELDHNEKAQKIMETSFV